MIFNVGAGGASTAEAVQYDNTESGLKATDVQSAVDEVIDSLQNENNESFNFGYLNGVRGFFTNPSRADDCFIPFKSVSSGKLTTVLGDNIVNLGFKPKVVITRYLGNNYTCLYFENYSTEKCIIMTSSYSALVYNLGSSGDTQIKTITENGFIYNALSANNEMEYYAFE